MNRILLSKGWTVRRPGGAPEAVDLPYDVKDADLDLTGNRRPRPRLAGPAGGGLAGPVLL